MAKRSSTITRFTGIASTSVGREVQDAYKIVEEYNEFFKQGNKTSALALLDELVSAGLRFQAGEKVYKIAQGMIFSTLKNTLPDNEYIAVCKEKFGISTQTADRYGMIYEGWASDMYLYSLPDDPSTGQPYNYLSLSLRDMEFGAQLIVTGEFDDNAAHTLFGSNGNWQEKREKIRNEVPKIVKRVSRRQKKSNPIKLYRGRDLVLESGGQIEWLCKFNTDSTNLQARALALRAREALRKEFAYDVDS